MHPETWLTTFLVARISVSNRFSAKNIQELAKIADLPLIQAKDVKNGGQFRLIRPLNGRPKPH